MKQSSSLQKLFLAVLSILGWMAIVLQFYLLMKNRSLPVGATIIQFFSYFTILTNILVATYSTILLIASSSKRRLWLSRPALATALTVYIVIVGCVYNIVLRFLWNPVGLQKIVDEVLHLIIPLLFLLYWLLFISKQKLTWNVFPWMLYPLIYLCYILVRGVFVNLYPYPFLEVNNIGIAKVIINVLILFAVFLGLSLLFVAIGKMVSKKVNQKQII